MTYADFTVKVGQLLGILLPDPPAPGTSLYDDLGLDSFQAFELVIVIETLADNLVPPDTVPELYTLGDAFGYYQSLRAAAVADP